MTDEGDRAERDGFVGFPRVFFAYEFKLGASDSGAREHDVSRIGGRQGFVGRAIALARDPPHPTFAYAKATFPREGGRGARRYSSAGLSLSPPPVLRPEPIPAPRPSMPAASDDLIAYLDSLGIATATVEHPPLHTVEESQALRGDIPGGHVKNLFVKDKKSRLFLLVLGEETPVDLKRVHERIGAQGRVSFGSAELLEEVWGVKPGAVTPFGAINDASGRVTVVLDATMMRCARLNFHPLVNTRTTGLASADLIKFLRATGHEPMVVELGREGVGVE